MNCYCTKDETNLELLILFIIIFGWVLEFIWRLMFNSVEDISI